MQLHVMFFIILLSGCSDILKPRHSPLQVENSSVSQEKPTVFFDEIIDKVISPHCLQCHSNYSNYQTVRQNLPIIINSVTQYRMPKDAPPLSPELIDLLQVWLEEGAFESPQSSEEGSENPTDTILPTWESLSLHVFEPKCFVCHNPNGEAPWIDFSSRKAMLKTLLETINLNDPPESILIKRLLDSEEPMPPLPPYSNIPQLSPEEVELVIQWIEDGLP